MIYHFVKRSSTLFHLLNLKTDQRLSDRCRLGIKYMNLFVFLMFLIV